MSTAPPGQEFRLSNGKVASSVKELAEILASSSEEEYESHVSEENNDFSNWVKNAIQEEDLAHELEVAKSKQEAVAALNNFTQSDEEPEDNEPDPEPEPEPEEPSHPEEEHDLPEQDKEQETDHKIIEDHPAEKHSEHHHVHIHLEFVYGTIFGILLAVLAYGLYTLI